MAMNKEKDPEGESMGHEVVVMDKDHREIVREMAKEEEAVPRRVYISRESGDVRVHSGVWRM